MLEPATEADINAALALTKNCETRVRLRNLLKLTRENESPRENETPREPLKIEIVNAGELKSDKVLSIKRDEATGKIKAATIMNADG